MAFERLPTGKLVFHGYDYRDESGKVRVAKETTQEGRKRNEG